MRVWPDIHLGGSMQPCHWQTMQVRPAGQAIDLGPEPRGAQLSRGLSLPQMNKTWDRRDGDGFNVL